MKEEGVVNDITVARLFKKFYSGCKNFYDQAKSVSSKKKVDSEAGFEAIEINPVSRILRVSRELGIS